MARQTASHIIMIRPAAFRYNEQTAVNNFFQRISEGKTSDEIVSEALAEFEGLVNAIDQAGVNVVVMDDLADRSTPDSIFPNNWMSLHEDGRIAIYPMFAENRRKERRDNIFESLESLGYHYSTITDFTHFEKENKYLEGTGSLVLDRISRIAYAAISERTHPDLVDEFCKMFGYKAVTFHAFQSVENKREPIYHTNVMMSMGTNIAIVCLDCVDDQDEREALTKSIRDSGKEQLELTEVQVNHFAGNMLELISNGGQPLIVMSNRAFNSLSGNQVRILERQGKIVKSKLDLIEQLGGGSARCMIAENFLPRM